MKLSRIIIFIIAFCSTISAYSQVSLESKVDRSQITIGDRIKYSVIIAHDENVKIELPEVGANLGSFEILGYNDPEPKKENGKITQVREYTVSTFEIGTFEIPPVTIRFITANDTTRRELTTEKIKIEVTSLKPSEEGDIKDIKPPLELERDIKALIKLIAAIVIAIIIVIIIIYIIKRRKAGKSLLPMKAKPPRPAHEIALEALEKLVNSDLLAQGQVKQFYIELTEIIRRYIEGRFSIIAIEMTTYQLVQNMRQANMEPGTIELIERFLSDSDMVKFAKYLPTAEETQAAVQQAFEIVNSTKIEVKPENGSATPEKTPDKNEPLQTESSVSEKAEQIAGEGK
jgi:hypothetical protein